MRLMLPLLLLTFAWLLLLPLLTLIAPPCRKLPGVPMQGLGVVLPYMGYKGVCHCEGYGFEAFYSGTGYIKQRVCV